MTTLLIAEHDNSNLNESSKKGNNCSFVHR